MPNDPPNGALIIATNNPHKVEELTEILAPLGFTLHTLEDAGLSSLPEPEETAHTFLGNATIKASYYARAAAAPCLADDSGLEVDALGGEPGVRSARYAECTGNREERDAANIDLLLANLADIPDDRRTARFVCAIALCDASGELIASARGTFEGRVAHAPKGSNGFGYDPLLVLTDPADPLAGKHAAELAPEEKHARSHRGQAAKAIAETLRRHPLAT